jgi:hypothetical protein
MTPELRTDDRILLLGRLVERSLDRTTAWDQSGNCLGSPLLETE